VSMSYGPGRYDAEYEERGHDYPLAYVRWTEGRNLEAFLDTVAARRVQTAPLVTHRFPIGEGERAYKLIAGDTNDPYLAVLLTYDTARELATVVERRKGAHERDDAASAAADPREGDDAAHADATTAQSKQESASATRVRVGLVGAGAYARGVLLPQFKAAGAEFRAVTTASGVTARDVGEKYDFASLASGADAVVDDPSVNLVVVATRHDTHAEVARRALEAGKHVFVEKPLALNDEDLERVIVAASRSRGRLVVGFNRRFSPHARAAREFFAERREPLSILYRVNAGRVPAGHWTRHPQEGGGRVVGEVCHFVDLAQFFAGAPPTSVFAEAIRSDGAESFDDDSVFVTLSFADGSRACVAYLAEGDRALAKERVEIFGAGRAFVIEDFRAAVTYAGGREQRSKLRATDKGQAAEVRAVCEMVLRGSPSPTPLGEIALTTRATFRILDSLRTGEPVKI
ncbi:MAG: Gfo/Idh/MocA family oxidoreductase, partial [Acidobacteria bacterium]|nr:Gfo/Idh/MocA family oxidoreductase [Acidobacteriota bacterium]